MTHNKQAKQESSMQELSIEYALLKGLSSKNFEQLKRLRELENMITKKKD